MKRPLCGLIIDNILFCCLTEVAPLLVRQVLEEEGAARHFDVGGVGGVGGMGGSRCGKR